MGLLQRLADVLKANINRILDQAEEPEMVLEHLIHEMQESYRKAKIEVAKALADEKRLKSQMQTNQDMASKWGRKALLAVEKSDDDLAREALKRKRSYEDLGREFELQWTEQKKVTDVLRENLFGLEGKIDEARRKKNLLAAKQRRALAQQKLRDTLEQATGEQTYLKLGQVEDKISEIEARTEAELFISEEVFEGRFEQLERPSDGVEDELLALKREVMGRHESEQPSRTLPLPAEEPESLEAALDKLEPEAELPKATEAEPPKATEAEPPKATESVPSASLSPTEPPISSISSQEQSVASAAKTPEPPIQEKEQAKRARIEGAI